MSARHVLTALHVVFQSDRCGYPVPNADCTGDRWAEQILVLPGSTGGSSPFAAYEYQVASILYWEPYLESCEQAYDIALIELDRPVGGLSGYLPYGGWNRCDLFLGSDFTNVAYPDGRSYDGWTMQERPGKFNICGPQDGLFDGLLGAETDTPSGALGSGFFDRERTVWGTFNRSAGVSSTAIGFNLQWYVAIAPILHYSPSSPDLIPMNLRCNPEIVAPGDTLSNFDFVIYNDSDHDFSGPVGMHAYLSTDNIIDPGTDRLIFTFDPPPTLSIAGHLQFRAIVQSRSIVIPSDWPHDAFEIGVVLDAADADTTNNITQPFDTAHLAFRSVRVTVNTPGKVLVDGVKYSNYPTFTWPKGSKHTLFVPPQGELFGSRMAWSKWETADGNPRVITATNLGWHTPTLVTEHSLTIRPVLGGRVDVESGFFAAGDTVDVIAYPDSGLEFVGWVGTGAGSYTGPNRKAKVIMWGPVTQEARFNAGAMHIVPGDSVPLWQEVRVVVEPLSGVELDGGTLYYRPTSGLSDYTSVSMIRTPEGFVGVIPASAVNEAADRIECYAKLEKGGFTTFIPVGSPDFGKLISILPPTVLDVIPDQVVSGSDLRVRVAVPLGTVYQKGALHYRRGGDRGSFVMAPLDADSLLPEITIPAAYVTERGLECWAEVTTLRYALTEPLGWPSGPPLIIRVRSDSLREATVRPERRYRMVSFPLDFGVSPKIEPMLADEPGFGPYDRTRWRLFRYSPSDKGNIEFTAADELFGPRPGRAFWLISAVPHQITASAGLSAPTDEPQPIPLESGWNQIGNPFAFPVARSSLVFPDGIDSLVAFDSDANTYSERRVMELVPFEGYFVYSAIAGQMWVRPEAARAGRMASARAAAEDPPWFEEPLPASPERWALRIRARTAVAADGTNLIGIHPEASEERDPFDSREPPPPPDRWAWLALPHPDWRSQPGFYRHDIRAPNGSGHIWEIEVRSEEPGEEVLVELELPQAVPQQGARALPAGLALRLIDTELAITEDLRLDGGSLQAYRFLSHGPSRSYRLKLIAGSQEFVERASTALASIPEKVVLEQNRPNPFNARTSLRFGLPQADQVQLRIYDTRGRLVSHLIDGQNLPAGFHQVIWDGTDVGGRHVASGVYLCRLETAHTSRSIRLVMLE